MASPVTRNAVYVKGIPSPRDREGCWTAEGQNRKVERLPNIWSMDSMDSLVGRIAEVAEMIKGFKGDPMALKMQIQGSRTGALVQRGLDTDITRYPELNGVYQDKLSGLRKEIKEKQNQSRRVLDEDYKGLENDSKRVRSFSSFNSDSDDSVSASALGRRRGAVIKSTLSEIGIGGEVDTATQTSPRIDIERKTETAATQTSPKSAVEKEADLTTQALYIKSLEAAVQKLEQNSLAAKGDSADPLSPPLACQFSIHHRRSDSEEADSDDTCKTLPLTVLDTAKGSRLPSTPGDATPPPQLPVDFLPETAVP